MTPKSVPLHLIVNDPVFWSVADVEWPKIDTQQLIAISGSAFIDTQDPYGLMCNPFGVVIGDVLQEDLPETQITAILARLGTPEIVFIRSLSKTADGVYDVLLTVLTPTGKELGACAHGFTGAIKVLMSMGRVTNNAEVSIATTLGTTAKVFVADGAISLEFTVQPPRELVVPAAVLGGIFGTAAYASSTTLPVQSVGSPKLMVEVDNDTFDTIQKNLGRLSFDALLTFEDAESINGIHVYARDPVTSLPSKAIQVNAYLGRENVIDPATGVSAAAQVSGDKHVPLGTTVTVTQYTARGPSAVLYVTKESTERICVGGTAALFNSSVL